MDAVQVVALVQTIPFIGPYAVWIPVLVLVCSALDALLPQPAAGSIWVNPRKIISAIGLSILNARNAIPAGAPKTAVELAAVAENVVAMNKPGGTQVLGFVLPLVLSLMVSACAGVVPPSVTAKLVQVATSPAGQLFCKLQLAGGGSMVVAAINAEATALVPGAAPVAVIATGASEQYVNDTCAAAAKAANATAGTPVSPPTDMSTTVQAVPVTVPQSS